ncbi:MAG TPA: phytanoyl-CoA dioxygenase family protein [Chitinophagaceae bacterium]|nr:phytanoyl-CoA dioxygenase family protein [Chitinophagaceae bacterium]
MNLRQFKPLHWVYNLLNYKKLKHNQEAYRKYNLNKPLISSISSKDFPDKESRAWLDVGDSSVLAREKDSFDNFSKEAQQGILDWSKNGYIILRQFFDHGTCDSINSEIDTLLRHKKIHFTNGNKLMFANKKSDLIKNISNNATLKNILNFLLDKEVVAFQTINFIEGSQQRAHSDSIHMTTYPLGYLIAVWIALEDVSIDNGPLFYYPGSHKLPYLLNSDFNEGETALVLGKKDYKDYEDVLEESVLTKGFQKKEFLANKGDVLIWHANLVHGGAPIVNKNLTRKSMVVHYYANDVVKYHEISERPSLLSPDS